MGAGSNIPGFETLQPWTALTFANGANSFSDIIHLYGYEKLCLVGEVAGVTETAYGGSGVSFAPHVSLAKSGSFWLNNADWEASVTTGTPAVDSLDGAVAAGDETITLSSATSYVAGDKIFIQDATIANSETAYIKSVAGNVLTLLQPLQYAHLTGSVTSNLVSTFILDLGSAVSVDIGAIKSLSSPIIQRLMVGIRHIHTSGPNIVWRSFVGYAKAQL